MQGVQKCKTMPLCHPYIITKTFGVSKKKVIFADIVYWKDVLSPDVDIIDNKRAKQVI